MYDQKELSSLDFSACSFITKPLIFWYKTPNNTHNFVSKRFCKYEGVKYICSTVWIAVVMEGEVAENEIRSAYWYNFLSEHILSWFLCDTVSENTCFEFDIHCKWN